MCQLELGREGLSEFNLRLPVEKVDMQRELLRSMAMNVLRIHNKTACMSFMERQQVDFGPRLVTNLLDPSLVSGVHGHDGSTKQRVVSARSVIFTYI